MKFAYLILAHDNPEQLKLLLQSLDYHENDIYLHIDKKNKELCKEDLEYYINHARLYVYKKFRVYWGDISQTKCQMFLLKQALKMHHDYYHLISGKDLPIKTQDEIIKFFSDNRGKEFVFFENNSPCRKKTCTKFHFFHTYHCKYTSKNILFIIRVIDSCLLKIQEKLNVNRKFYCGDNWYSITEKLAADFSKHMYSMIREVYFTVNSDELILQTFLFPRLNKYCLYNEKFDGNRMSNVRKIDWNRGQPYIWRKEDYNELREAPHLFARKFDERVDSEIIQLIYDKIKKD